MSVPSLQRLSITKECATYGSDEPRLEISTPCSKYLRSLNAEVLDLTDSLIFNRLLHLELNVCNSFRSKLLLSLLKYFPNLQSLNLGRTYPEDTEDQLYCLGSEPSSVPKCLSFHLESIQWRGYAGTLDEREAAAYILKNAHRLKTSTIRLHTTYMDNGQIIMKDLTSMSKASASCQLVIE
uniref:FBD domain-containing protein n=1 Tax=Brassica oleracea var. oleracea TaxID=109376 RepID=A0A0D3B3W4_BRAOL